MGQVIGREQCPKCSETGGDRSADNLARYEDGGAKCFACDYYEKPKDAGSTSHVVNNIKTRTSVPLKAAMDGFKLRQVKDSNLEGLISPRICRMFNYLVGKDKTGHKVEVALFPDAEGDFVAGHVRYENKGKDLEITKPDGSYVTKKGTVYFPWKGDQKSAGFFGQQLWGSGKRLAITEGERDALAFAEATDGAWQVVSIKSGAGPQILDSFKDHLDFLQRFEEIVLFFDNDKPGRNAVQAVCETYHHILPLSIARPLPEPYKDCWDALMAGDRKAILHSFWQASKYRPKDISMMSEMKANFWSEDDDVGFSFPDDELTKILRGSKRGEYITLTAGTGVGKTETIIHWTYHWHMNEGLKVGLMLMEDPDTNYSIQRYLSRHMQRDISELPRSDEPKPGHLSYEEYSKAWDELFGDGRDIPILSEVSFGSYEDVVSKVQYMIKALGCDVVVVDNITQVVDNVPAPEGERKLIAKLVEGLKSTAKNMKALVVGVSHLSRDNKKSFEDGDIPKISDLYGASAIEKKTDIVVANTRRTRDPEISDLTQVHVLKNRRGRRCEPVYWLRYDPDRCIMEPVPHPKGWVDTSNKVKEGKGGRGYDRPITADDFETEETPF